MDAQHLPVVIVGAGPVGLLVALMFAIRGYAVEIFEARPDHRQQVATADASSSGLHGQLTNPTTRSINITLSERGLCALRAISRGLESDVLKNSVALSGRMVHPKHQTDVHKTNFQPYEHR